jgi:hypothetical protein
MTVLLGRRPSFCDYDLAPPQCSSVAGRSRTKEGHEDNSPAVGQWSAVKVAGWELLRVVEGEIAELTQYCDLITLMNQIGALPTAALAKADRLKTRLV